MTIFNILLLIVTFVGSYFLSRFFDKKYEIKEKLYKQFKDSTWSIWLIILSYISIIALVVITDISLKSQEFYTKIGYVFIMFVVAYYSDYHKYKK